MKRIALMLLWGLFASTAAGAGQVESVTQEVRRLSGADLNAAVRDLKDGTAVYLVPTDGKAIVLLARRDRDGEVEVHGARNDEMIVREGEAILRVGTDVRGARSLPDGERRGGILVGAHDIALSAGDVVWIPPGQKHWHGAAPTTAMTHIAITELSEGKAVDWLEKVMDAEYSAQP